MLNTVEKPILQELEVKFRNEERFPARHNSTLS